MRITNVVFSMSFRYAASEKFNNNSSAADDSCSCRRRRTVLHRDYLLFCVLKILKFCDAVGNKLIILIGLVLLWFISYYCIRQNLVLIIRKCGLVETYLSTVFVFYEYLCICLAMLHHVSR